MKYGIRSILTATLLASSSPSFPFPTDDVEVTSSPSNSDDLIVWEAIACKFRQSYSPGYCFISNDGKFSVYGSSGSVKIVREMPATLGFKFNNIEVRGADIEFSGMDLAPLASNDPDAPEWSMKLIFNKDFTWVELFPLGSQNYPIYSTVFFFGPSEDTYSYYYNAPGAKYINYNKFKDHIQRKYADKFNPDHPGMIRFRAGVKAVATDLSTAF